MRQFSSVVVCLLLVCCAPLSGAVDKADAEISVTAEGSAAVINGDIAKAEDEALSDAKRNAVEKALGVLVKADTLGADYQVVADRILTHSEGYISTWQTLPNSRRVTKVHGHELLTIRIEASVKLTNLIGDSTSIEPIYNAVQRPRIKVLIVDEIDGKRSDGPGTCATAVLRALKSRGFEVVDASSEDAEILILGTAKTIDGPTDSSGSIATASAVVDARVVYADTAQVLYTAKQVQGRGASLGGTADAKLKALSDVGDRLLRADSQKFISQLLAVWAIEVQSGRVYKVVAEGLSSAESQALQIALADLRGHVEFIGQAAFSDGRTTVSVRNKLTPDQFRERVSLLKIGKKALELRESSGLAVCVRVK